MTSSVSFIIPHSSFSTAFRRRSQVVRQRSAKPLFVGSIPTAAFNRIYNLRAANRLPTTGPSRSLPERTGRSGFPPAGNSKFRGRADDEDGGDVGEGRHGGGGPPVATNSPKR